MKSKLILEAYDLEVSDAVDSLLLDADILGYVYLHDRQPWVEFPWLGEHSRSYDANGFGYLRRTVRQSQVFTEVPTHALLAYWTRRPNVRQAQVFTEVPTGRNSLARPWRAYPVYGDPEKYGLAALSPFLSIETLPPHLATLKDSYLYYVKRMDSHLKPHVDPL